MAEREIVTPPPKSKSLSLPVNHAFERYSAVVFPLLVMAAAIETFLILLPLWN